jgi:LysM repeat protein
MKEKQRDLHDTVDMNAVGDEYLEDLDYPSWRTTQESPPSSRWPDKTKLILILSGVGLGVVIILAFMFASGGRNDTSAIQIKVLEARLKQLEERVAGFEGIDKKLVQIEEQNRGFASLAQRLDSLEKSATTPKAAVSSGQMKGSQYYKVKTGDTLYGISHRYGLTVDQLRRLNKLVPGEVIHPEQKLIVGTGSNG